MKKTLLLLALALTMVFATASVVMADSNDYIAQGTSGDLDWSIDNAGCLTISGIGDYDDSDGEITNGTGAWKNYKNKIKSAIVDVHKITNCSGMFSECVNLRSIDITNLDTSDTTNMSHMFDNCDMKTLDVSGLNTGGVTDMSAMFQGCTNLTYLDLSNFNTQSVEDMSFMFGECVNLKTIKFSINFQGHRVRSMDYMFGHCEKLQSLDLSEFMPYRVEYAEDMLQDCDSLKTIKTPTYLPVTVKLSGSTWKDSNWKIYKSLPKNSSKSITLTKVATPKKVTISKTKRSSKTKAKVTWEKVSGASGYKVVYSTSKSMKSAKTKTVTKGSTTSKTLTKLNKGKKYYVKVQAYKTYSGHKVYGSYSSVKIIKAK